VTGGVTATAGFGSSAEAYERGRPGYPKEVVDLLRVALGLGPGSTVVDVAAGTGKLTRALRGGGAEVVAVEPVAAMRSTLAAVVPGVHVVAAWAESLPLRDGGADAVTVAQAFHWFDAPRALAEAARLLHPGGGLGLVWNEPDESMPWVARLLELIDWRDQDASRYQRTDFAAVVAACGRFTPLEHESFRHDHGLDARTLVDRVLSVSYVAARPPEARASVAAAVRRLVEGRPEPFAFPYVARVFWCHRR
jgi:SAM-dependent methyltransferase